MPESAKAGLTPHVQLSPQLTIQQGSPFLSGPAEGPWSLVGFLEQQCEMRLSAATKQLGR